jgi:hypothetical protein
MNKLGINSSRRPLSAFEDEEKVKRSVPESRGRMRRVACVLHK